MIAVESALEKAIRTIYYNGCTGEIVQTFEASGVTLEVCESCRRKLLDAIEKDQRKN